MKNAAISIAFPNTDPPPPASVKPITGSGFEIADQLAKFLSHDVDHIVVWLHPMTPQALEGLGEILALLD